MFTISDPDCTVVYTKSEIEVDIHPMDSFIIIVLDIYILGFI